MGGMYIEGMGRAVPCDRLPFNIERCPICDQGIKFSRGFTWIHWYRYAGIHDPCKCKMPNCPICKPRETYLVEIDVDKYKQQPVKYGLMWVGKKYYTPESFMDEAYTLGVCKRIATIPKEIELDQTWILLAHQEAGIRQNDKGKDEKCSAVFYAFRPHRIIKIINKKQAKDKQYLENLAKRGITPLVGITNKDGKIVETFELDEWNKKGFLEKFVK
jgi:hypothetical protein